MKALVAGLVVVALLTGCESYQYIPYREVKKVIDVDTKIINHLQATNHEYLQQYVEAQILINQQRVEIDQYKTMVEMLKRDNERLMQTYTKEIIK